MRRSLLILGLLAVLAARPAGASAGEAFEGLPAGFSTVTQARGLADPTAVAFTPDVWMRARLRAEAASVWSWQVAVLRLR